MKPINMYRSDGDREVWEQAERDAAAAQLSISAYVAAVLRRQQELAEGDCARDHRHPATIR